MESKEFKKLFGEIAKSTGFDFAYGGWFKESTENIIVLELQKSNFGNYYELNVKVFVQGMFGNVYIRNKDLVKRDMGDIFRRQPVNYNDVLNLDNPIDDEKRKESILKLFEEFIGPFVNKALTKSGIIELAERGEITLLPAVKKELGW